MMVGFEDDDEDLEITWNDWYRRKIIPTTIPSDSVPPTKHLCVCDKYDVINFGCKCGGL